MAKLGVDSRTGWPRCTGCGEVLSFIPWMFDSRIRGPEPWRGPDDRRCSSAPQVAAFAEKHRQCAPPIITISNAVIVTDRRGYVVNDGPSDG